MVDFGCALKVGDYVEITKKTKIGVRNFCAAIKDIKDRGDFYYISWSQQGLVQYDPNAGQFGAIRLYKNGPREFGVQSINVIGKAIYTTQGNNSFMIRNPGYDLMY